MDNVALDVIIGLVFIYLLFSILLTSLAELVYNHGLGLRGKNLKVAIKSAFGAVDGRDKTADSLVDRFFAHGLIASLYEGKRVPSEIPADMFSKAFLAVLGDYSGPADRPATPAELLNKLKRDNNLPNRERLVGVLDQLLPGTETSWENYERNVANWFAQVGDRSKGWYKRKLDRRILVLALGLAVIGNVDTLFIMRMLQLDKQHRELLASQAANVVANAEGKPAASITAPKSAAVQRMELRDQVDARLVSALVGLRNSILDSVPLRTALYRRCPNPEQCDFNPYKWYEKLDELRRSSWDALSPGSAVSSSDKAGATSGRDKPETPKAIVDLANDLRSLSANLYLAYPDPVRKEDAEIKKQLTALRPSIDEAAQLLQRQLDADKAVKDSIQRVCGEKATDTIKCVELYEKAAAGEIGFPIGWSADLREFQKQSVNAEWSTTVFGVWLSGENILGLVLTALALMLGAPFWFDVLRRVVSLRAAGTRRDEGLTTGVGQGKPPPAQQLDGGPAPSPSSPTGGGWFSDAVNDVERRLSAEQIRQLQSRLKEIPISGRLDAATRDKIYAWRQMHRPGAEPSWELDEPMVRELLWQTPDPLSRDASILPSTTVLPATDGPLADLKLGSQGPEVVRLRGLLAAVGFLGAPSSAAETFDDELDRAVKEFQKENALSFDGVVGPATWLKLTNEPHKLPLAFSTPVWMRYAIHEIGITELAGTGQDNPRIGEYQRETGATPDDEIPWCSSFANWVMKRAGIKPSGSAVASSWREWEVDTPARYGAVIVVLQVGKPIPGRNGPGAHVGFLVRETADRYFVIGGNQGKEGAGSVCLTAFPKSSWRCLAMRWPKEEGVIEVPPQSAAAPEDTETGVAPSRFVAETLTEPTLEYGSGDRTAIARLQSKLNASTQVAQIDVDGIFGKQTQDALIEFQKKMKVPVSGIADPATWYLLLQASAGGRGVGGDAGAAGAVKQPLSRADIESVLKAKGMDLGVPLIEAVLQVESSGRGFVDGVPVVRLEGHKLWEYAEKLNVKPASWTDVGFGLLHRDLSNRFVRRGKAEFERLQEARKLCDKMLEAGVPPNDIGVTRAGQLADLATSWGLFQIMGSNWKLCGVADLQTFVDQMSASETVQLELFFAFLQKHRGGKALDALRDKQWATFAEIYNGPKFRVNSYDTKLERAYAEIANRTRTANA
ncbi:TIGR02594 family protein [Aromatoleum evansii]|uniref:TIGR02594 family protein n=1 Tax=Aromatoleum evansii TaxID=59406 RepID=UPI00145C4DAB|nr:TIGR02594 family protein [Aromatoleum evansii]NMG32503.1 TIGR02594 family protein [Aromatoleum evansii]